MHTRYQPGEEIGGRFRVHQVLLGGMGEVYLCLDQQDRVPLALKTFQERYMTPDMRDSFFEEVQHWIALQKHPHLVRCFWMQTIDNIPFAALEWVAGAVGRGTDLRSWLRRGPLEVQTALTFAIHICRGLLYAQEKQPGLVHRDLKPDNVLIDQDHRAKITDFGLAKIVGQTATDHPAGTPPYMPPEQWRGDELDPRADIYALGCILYEVLTGAWPFVGKTIGELRQHHLQTAPPKLKKFPPVNSIVQRCLAKDPAQRYPTLAQLLDALQGVYQHECGQPPPPAPPPDAFGVSDYVNRGNTYYQLGLYEEALADFEHALEHDPDHATALSNRGMVYHEQGAYQQAVAAYEAALERDSSMAIAHANRANSLHEMGQHAAAFAAYSLALELDPKLATVYANRANASYERGNYVEALADCDQALALDPALALAYATRGNAYRKQGRFEQALQDYAQALELDPFQFEALANRGVVWHEMGRYQAALRDFDAALRLKPQSATTHVNRGNTLDAMDQPTQAVAAYTEAIRSDPALAAAYLNRGNIHRSQGHHTQAFEDYNAALKADPANALAYFNRGICYATLGQDDQALADFEEALRLNPDDAPTYFNKGALLFKTGHHDQEAYDCFRAAYRLGYGRALDAIARVRRTLGMPERHPQEAFGAFQQVQTREQMRSVLLDYPQLASPEFIQVIEDTIATQVPPGLQPAFRQRLEWIHEIVNQ